MGKPAGQRLGEFLKVCREERRLSLRQVERLSEAFSERIANSYLANCERGRFIPSVQKLLTLSRVFGIPLQSFVDRIDLEQHGALKPELDSFEACRDLGIEEAQRGNLGRAFACFERSLEVLERQGGDVRLRLTAEIDIAIVLKRMGKHSAARDALEHVLRRREMPPALRVRALDILAGVQRERGNLTLALVFASEADRLARLHDERQLRPHTCNTLANIYYDLGDDASAAPWYERALRRFRRAGETIGLIVATSNYGNCLLRLGRRGEGLARLNEALELARREDTKRLTADVLGYLARAHYQASDFTAARRLALDSIQIARRGDYFDTLFANHFYLWRMARAEGKEKDEGIYFKSLNYFRTKLESTLPELEEFDQILRSAALEKARPAADDRRFRDAIRKARGRARPRPSTVHLR
jgi:tetratricopeptide (TPR) repeat protein